MFQKIPTVTKNLLIINVIVFLACQAFPILDLPLTGYYFQSENFKIWQVISHMFMHGGVTHLFMNMFALYMFGSVLEKYWGAVKFLNYYILCGLGAFGLHQFITYLEVQKLISALPANLAAEVFANGYDALMQGKNYSNADAANLNLLLNVGLVGASGCVFGLLLAFGMMFPNTELMMIFLPIPIKAKWFVLGYGVIEFLQAFANREGDNVAHFAHLGGMLFGYIILKIWQTRGKLYS